MLIELDIFSGRPNPRWRLNELAEGTLRQLHQHLWLIHSHPPEPPGLGYRGFSYTLDGTTWRAYKGWAVSSSATLIDRGHTVERLLLEQLPADYAELRPRVLAELE